LSKREAKSLPRGGRNGKFWEMLCLVKPGKYIKGWIIERKGKERKARRDLKGSNGQPNVPRGGRKVHFERGELFLRRNRVLFNYLSTCHSYHFT